MTNRYTQLMAWVEPETKTALRRVKDRDGINVSEQVRRALRTWLRVRAADRPATEERRDGE